MTHKERQDLLAEPPRMRNITLRVTANEEELILALLEMHRKQAFRENPGATEFMDLQECLTQKTRRAKSVLGKE